MDEKFKKKYGIYDGIDTSTSHTVMMITKQTGMF